MDFDVIVLGSGMGGLTCASRLSILGYKVAVFEKHFIPGGYATNFKRKGYNFDVSLHGIGGLDVGGNTYNILKHCNVLDKITPLKNKTAYSIMYKDKLIDIPNDLSSYKSLLYELFPNYNSEITKLFNAIDKFSNGFKKFVLDKDSSFFNKLNLDCFTFIKWSGKTTDEVIRHYIDNDDFVYVFTALWPYYGLPPQKLSALYFFIPWISYHYHGKFYIEGGSQKLSNSMVDTITENGGVVNLKSEVSSITYKNNIATGISLKNGNTYTSKYIVSNMNPSNTFNIIENYDIPIKYKKALDSPSIGCTLSQLYIGLDCNPNAVGINSDEIFCFNKYTPEKDYEISLQSDYENCGLLITNYNNMDESLNKDDYGVLTITLLDNYDNWSTNKAKYADQKSKLTSIILDRLESMFPKVKNHIKVIELGTPRTMERYTSNPKGAVYGYSQVIKQAGRHRLKSETPIDNLFLVGAWVKPGGGYEGAISSGMIVAQNIDKFLNGNS